MYIKKDGRNRLTSFWIPSSKGTHPDPKQDDSHTILIKTGFLQQAYSGVFHLLPLGLRVQGKLEKLIDRCMSKLGASKVSLSSISHEALWRKSGRLQGDTSELLRLKSRAGDGFILSPTHEEEITKLVATSTKLAKELPIRLYQISRKYRDEKRPRQGLLRTREFLMKDLYTFDADETTALETYHAVKDVYNEFFNALKVPFLVAKADSGNIGGTYSHEFHFASPIGEDNIISCDSCDYVANEELAEAFRTSTDEPPETLARSYAISRDGTTLIQILHPLNTSSTDHHSSTTQSRRLNQLALKRALPTIDTSVEAPLERWLHNTTTQRANPIRITRLIDAHTQPTSLAPLDAELSTLVTQLDLSPSHIALNTLHSPHSLLAIQPGDLCPTCHGHLSVTPAIELGHTFHLGTRYSAPLDAVVQHASGERRAMVMGCHGIGVSRVIGAVAAVLMDDRGLNWPAVIAPFEAVLVPGKAEERDVVTVYDVLRGVDTVLDDRSGSLVEKMIDADLVGYPVIVVLGREWARARLCEVQCRRLAVKRTVSLEDLETTVKALLEQL